MEVTFKFQMHERVLTPFDEEGVVSFCGYDRRGNRYLIDLPKARSDWFDEELLKTAEHKPRI